MFPPEKIPIYFMQTYLSFNRLGEGFFHLDGWHKDVRKVCRALLSIYDLVQKYCHFKNKVVIQHNSYVYIMLFYTHHIQIKLFNWTLMQNELPILQEK
jgi:hypothetical protein